MSQDIREGVGRSQRTRLAEGPELTPVLQQPGDDEQPVPRAGVALRPGKPSSQGRRQDRVAAGFSRL